MKRIFISLVIFSVIKSGIGIATKIVIKPVSLGAKGMKKVASGASKKAVDGTKVVLKDPVLRTTAIGAVSLL